MKTVYLIGTGTAGGSLTADAAAAIHSADMLIGAERMLKPYENTGKTLLYEYLSENISAAVHGSTVTCAAVLFSGDIGFFSGAKKLLPLLHDLDVRVLPGISSFAAFCAKCGISYENMRLISLHGCNANIAVHVKTNERCFFLLGGDMTAAAVCRRLCEYGLSDVTVHIGSNLGYDSERILHGTVQEMANIQTAPLAVMITENHAYTRYLPSAIPDSAFIRGKIPMTKAEVRCNAVAAQRIAHDAVCWDIGCGTGSVSVEAAFRCPDGQVYAFDRSAEAVRLTAENARNFSCDNICVTHGSCPDILRDAPKPDAVFIGGTGGRLPEILKIISEKNPCAAITMAAVSLETLAQAVPLLEQFCGELQVVQIAVTRTKKVGAYTMPDTQNPVWLISGGLQCSVS